MLTTLLLIAIVWLLWTIHQDLGDLIDRQRGLKTGLERISSRLDRFGEPAKSAEPAAAATPAAAAEKVAINSASKAQLRKLPKVGAVIADRLIEKRPFSSFDEIAAIEGVRAQIMEGVRANGTLD